MGAKKVATRFINAAGILPADHTGDDSRELCQPMVRLS